MRRNPRRRIFSLCLALGLFAALFPGRALAEEELTDRFVDGTIINGLNVTGMTEEEAKELIEAFYEGEYALRIRDREGKQEILHDTDIGYRLEVTGDLGEILERQNVSGRVSGPDVDNRYTVQADARYDEERLKSFLEAMSFVKTAKKTEDARISDYREGVPFSIIPEVQGNDFDMEKLMDAVKNALDSQKTELDLSETDCYKTVRVHGDDPELKELCKAMNRVSDMTVTYRFGDREEILSGEVLSGWILGTEDGRILVDEEKAAAYVRYLADTYDTYGKPHGFLTTSGEEVTVKGPYGWQIDQEAEREALAQAIQSGESAEREPVYKKTAASRSGNDYGDTYVEVDLKNQHLYLYEDGACIIDAPFVSGNVSRGWTTPDGLYYLYYKQRDKVLRGEDYATPVKYWMPFNGGIGLHDADWRSQFGGEIYKNSGSHGCINLPPEKAAEIYEHVYKNMPVICHGQGTA